MKKQFTLFFLICLTKILTASPDNFFETKYHNSVVEHLKFLNGKFPHEPVKGYPWLTVTINNQKAILICPEDGHGDALLVFQDGTVKRKLANSGEVTLSFYTIIKPESGKKWHELKSVNGWEKLEIKKNNFFAENIARHFNNAFFKAIHEIEIGK
jgi:hypothetical protein